MVAASMAPDRFGGIRSASTTREVSIAAVGAETRTTEEVMAVKATEEATTVKVVADRAAIEKVAADKRRR
jgi:hypothetical protein